MYKDPDKQREANAERQRRYKARSKALLEQGVTKGVTPAQVDVLLSKVLGEPEGDTPNVIPNKLTIQTLEKSERGEGLTEFDNAEALLEDLHDTNPKRGKDIKCFDDLPSEVRRIIEVMSTTGGKIDQAAKDRRTAIAIHYQTTCFGPQGM